MTYHAVHLTPDPARAMVWQAVADHLAPWIPADARVIEIGAGYCAWINAVRAKRRVAVDIWPDVAAHAGPGVETMVLDASRDLPSLGTSSFDIVLASNVLEHFDPDTAASVTGDLHALLTRGGRLIVIQPNFRHASSTYFDDYTHRSIFTHVSLPALLRSRGFEIELVKARFLPYSMRGFPFPIARWLVRGYLASPIKPLAGQMLVVARRG